MNYPDGSTIKVGDLIWWNEGQCVGYVQVIADSKSEFEKWGFDTAHFFVSNTHPFDPALLTGVAHDKACLKDEGIGLLSVDERIQLQRATDKACDTIGRLDYSTYSVTTDVQHCRLTGWFFTFYKDGKELEKVRVPVEDATNA